jgi:hypothetical protein
MVVGGRAAVVREAVRREEGRRLVVGKELVPIVRSVLYRLANSTQDQGEVRSKGQDLG